MFAVRLDGGAEFDRLVVEVDVLYGVGEAEVGQDDVEHPSERLGFVGETDAWTLQHVRDHHRTRHCMPNNISRSILSVEYVQPK